jgi:hypothetical protein
MLKTLLITTSLAAGLMLLDVAQPVLTGGIAEAAPPRRVAAARPRPAPRMNVAKPRVNFARPKSNFSKPKAAYRFKPAPKIVHTKPAPRIVKPIKVNPQALKGTPAVSPQALKGSVNPGLGKPGPHLGLKNGPSFGKKLALGPAAGLKPGTFIKVANKSWPIHKGPHKLWWKGGWKTFVPFTAISVALIGGAYYYPDAYVSVARPYCSGVTPDGCQLNWQQVAFEGGGSEWQCVEYCQRPNQPRPAQAAALVVAPPAPANGRCEVEIFAQPKFAGVNAPSEVDQPRLAEAGWKNEIASIQVKAGTWDFFSEDEFAGENMRLPPGPYPELGPQWTKRIGSFMCVQGG